MLFTITSKHIELKDDVKAYAEEKCSKLPRFYNSVTRVDVVIEGNEGGGNHNVEIIAKGEHSNVFVASESGEDTLACIDLAIHKLERQLRRKKGKERNNKHIAGAGDHQAYLEQSEPDDIGEEVA